MTAADWAMLVALSLLWGGSFLFVAVAVRELPPFLVVALRLSIAAAVLWLVCLATGRRVPSTPAIWATFLGMGFLNNIIPFSLIVWGQTQIASGLASVLNATTPVFTVILAHFLTSDEKLSPNRLAGVLLGLAGVAVMTGPAALVGLDKGLLGQLAVLGAATSYALSGIFGRRFGRLGLDPLATATGQVTASSLVMVPLALVFDKPWTLSFPSLEVSLSILGLAILSTAIAYNLFFRILASAGATNVALVTLLVPVSAILFGIVLLGESLGAGQIAGMALIALGLAAIDGRLLRRFRR